MDTPKSIENLFNAIKAVRSNQKGQAERIILIEKKIESFSKLEVRLDKLEEAFNNEKSETDIRFDSAIDRFGNIGKDLDDHVDSIDTLEEEKDKVTKNVRRHRKLKNCINMLLCIVHLNFSFFKILS